MELPSKNDIIKTLKNRETPVINGISVKNAGVVLLNNYIELLFERLNLVKEKNFTSIENQIKAVQYLEYVITGSRQTEESYLSLPKLICGIPLTNSVAGEIEISEENKELIEGLITAITERWYAIGSCTVDGFRGNWLVRNGLLLELEDKWELTVEKRAYDLLIHKSPFSFSIIKYPWMSKPLHVNWSF
ncbi:contractile injection system tape measure protein [Flavobacterium sp.]|uniref:contractile injection system tape measure protein n=1 Tax=Flavobacterium sp. TaxID=239 RepID=UPI003D0D1926